MRIYESPDPPEQPIRGAQKTKAGAPDRQPAPMKTTQKLGPTQYITPGPADTTSSADSRIPDLSRFPAELKTRPQWVCWRLETRKDKPTKIPYSPITRQLAKSDDPATWGTLEQALTYLDSDPTLSGIGFMFSADDPYSGTDLDKVIDPATGEILKPWALDAIERIDSYTEISPSGCGLHILVKAKLPSGGHNDQKAGREMYDQGRYFTVTGRHWTGTPLEVKPRQDAVTALYREWWPSTQAADQPKPKARPSGPDLLLSDQALIDKAHQAKNGAAFAALWRGDTSAYGNDHSAADLALCSLLAFWTNGDLGRIDRLFRQSNLFRSDKWDKRHSADGRTYGQMTVDKAMANCREGYTGERSQQNGADQHQAGGGNSRNRGNRGNRNGGAHDKQSSPERDWIEPLPLRREIPPPEPFPIAALGDVLKNAALAMMEVIQSPAAICAQSVLAGAALAVQGYANIVIDGRTFPLSGYFITVAESGERKTVTDQAGLAPHGKRQRDLRRVYEGRLTEYENNLAAWKKTREEALSAKANKTLEAKKRALEALGPEPLGPVDAILMVEEPTYEGLVKALSRGWPSMGLFSDEGGRFLGGHGMNQDNLLKTAAGLSKLWDGSPITRTRGGDGNMLLYGRRLSLHLMIQPTISHLLFGNGLLIGQGLLSRCLVAWPESNIGQHRYSEQNLTEHPAMRHYFGRLLGVLETPLPLAEGTQNELEPRHLPLDRQAKKTWVAFHDHVSVLCAPDRELHTVKGLAAKAAEHAARLAGVLTLVGNANASAIALPEMEFGIALVEFYLGEALRLFDAAADNPDLKLAEACLTWARARGGRFAAETLYRLGPNAIRDKASAERILKILAEHGLARPLPAGTVVDEKPRKNAWEVRP